MAHSLNTEVLAAVEVTKHDYCRQRRQQCGADQRIPQQRTTSNLCLIHYLGEDLLRFFTVSLSAQRLTVLYDFVIGHQGLGPVDHTQSDTQHGEGGAQTQKSVLQAQQV